MRSTTERGYGAKHKAKREEWRPVVDAGQAHCAARICHKPTRWIEPGTPWDLGHTEDRSTWTGPEHRYCNRWEPTHRGQDKGVSDTPTRWTF